jgi:hypothetical protein
MFYFVNVFLLASSCSNVVKNTFCEPQKSFSQRTVQCQPTGPTRQAGPITPEIRVRVSRPGGGAGPGELRLTLLRHCRNIESAYRL